ncbi:ankyrin repeat and protein kinase domain-containing protein 1-like [Anabrus simplex]|uniref:ankyrin repeat and protein kinase domain-containing protein 1-like n=1 Tax=Anabrus simplex TaxID=316456 RepID=UPI0035A2FA01
MTGIIDSVTNGKPHFIHRTFLEYFSAKWFAENYSQNQDLIRKKFFTSDYSVIRAMFDQILARNCSLHEAVLNRDVKAVERLINTVNVNSLDAGGRTPIHLVAIMHDSAPEVIEKCKQISMLLLSHGANITIADAVFHWTPLRYADATQAWNIVGLILEHGGCTKDLIFTKMQLKNMTYIIPALCDATKGGYHKFLNFLVRSGIKVNIVLDCNKRQMIHLAAEYGQVVIVEYLLKAGVKLHIRDGKGWMPVHYAARTNHVDMVRYLLSGQYPVTWMKNGHNPENLIENKCKTAVNLVLQKSQSLAIQRASDVNVQDSYKWTPLHHAASTGQLEVVRYLCKEQAAQVDAVDQDGWTPLHYACSNDHLDVVKYLVETAGAYPDQRDRCQQTPLHSCVIRGRLRIVRYLAEEGGANINVQDQGGWTLLHCAAMSSRLDIVKYLTETLGANLLSRDKLGQTPLDMACGQDIRLYLTHYLAQGDVTTWKY